MSKRLTVFLAAPIPPPEGGITNWVRIVVDGLSARSDVFCQIIDTSLKKAPGERGFAYSVKGALGIVHRARRQICATDAACFDSSVLHICTSGGMGFLRDLGIMLQGHRKGIPAVVHLHFGRVPQLLEKNSLEARLLKCVLSGADAIVSMDEKTCGALIAKGFEDKTCLIPNPIEDSIFHRQCSIRCNEVVFVGHVLPSKGVSELVEAWGIVSDQCNDVRLSIIGPVDTAYKEELEAIDATSSVNFCGPIDHNAALGRISRARALVLPSHTEGFPNVVLEAMALNTPVIATPVGAIPEMLADGAGVIVPVGDVKSLAAAIVEMVADDDSAAEMVMVAHDRAESSYALSRVLEKLIAIWTSCVRGR